MSKLDKLVGKGKEIEIGGIHIDIKPLTASSMVYLIQLEKEETKAEAIKQIVRTTLKDSVPDATDEEIDKIGIEYVVTIMETIMEVNNLQGIEKGKSEFLENIKAKQNVKRTGNTGNKKAE